MVVAMGDTNGLALAQESHEAMLHSGGCLRPEHTLRNSRVAPNAAVWDLTYVDDHHVSKRLPRNRVACVPGHSVSCPFCSADVGKLDDVGIVETQCRLTLGIKSQGMRKRVTGTN